MDFIEADVLIVGGGVGGCACALAACSAGLKVVMTEESDWIGGQFTSQITPPDEHGWIEQFGCTANYRAFRERVRAHYRANYPLTEAARSNRFLNPGDGWVSPLCAEPKVFLSVLHSMLGGFEESGSLRILRNTVAVSAEKTGMRVKKTVVENEMTRERTSVAARYFVDATETGDLLPLTGTDFVTGAESKDQTGEPNAKESPEPENSQAFSMCFALSHHLREDHTIDKPVDYDFWRAFVPELTPPWSGRLLSMTGLSPRTMKPVTYMFAPNVEPNKAFAGLWTYRRILHRENFEKGVFDSDVTVVNYPQIDYMLGDLSTAERNSGGGRKSRSQMIAEARRQSLSFLYYLQVELGMRGLKLRGDITGTADGIAKMPYVRESRRIKAVFTVKEQHVSAACRPGERFGEVFGDSVGIGFYRIDLHPTCGGDNYLDVEALPFQIPLGALLPTSTDNLLPACKNIGTTHITNGCYRLHPIEWNIGEAVGQLIAFSLSRNVSPGDVRQDAKLLYDFQMKLRTEGFELEWPSDLDLEEGDPHRHAK
jgi:hypothetical protein